MTDLRAQLRLLVAAISTAATHTVLFMFPDFPEAILVAWGGAVMGAVGVGEGIWDAMRKKPAA